MACSTSTIWKLLDYITFADGVFVRYGDVRIGHTSTGITHNVTYRYYRDRDILIYVASNKLDKDFRGELLPAS